MVALIGFTSLAVDLGRVQLVRGELQAAADAAARHAAYGFRAGGVVSAQNYAIDAADDNNADGAPVVLDRSEDIEFGTWNSSSKQFTKLPDSQRDRANALRVIARRIRARNNAVPLPWASLVNMPTCDVTVRSIVRLAPATSGAAFVGLISLQIGNNAVFASYDASDGPPGGTNLSEGGNIASNGPTQVGNNSQIQGDVISGPSGTFTLGNGGSLSGDESDLTAELLYPPTESSPVPVSGVLNVGHGETVTLPAGTYCYSQINIDQDGTLTFASDATVYVTRTVTMGNKATIAGAGNDPGKLKLRLVGLGGTVQAANNCTVIALVYAPQASFDVGTNVHLRGHMVAQQASFGNNAELYYDIGSGLALQGGNIVLLD